MKVLILNGSPRVGGNTTVAVEEMERIFREEGVEVETVQVGTRDIRGCIACGRCAETGRCVFDDIVNELAPKLEAADGLVVPRLLRQRQCHAGGLPDPAFLQQPL